MKEVQTERNLYFDFLKGIAIIFVVAIHTFGNIYTYENLNAFALVLRQILNCAVPIFCVSSAYFLAGKNFNIMMNRKKVYRQLIRVYVPFLVCSVPYFVLDLLAKQNIFISIIKYLSCSYSIYYFVAMIMQFYILFALFHEKLFKHLFVFFAITIAYWIVYIYFIKPKISLPLILYAGSILGWVVYFSLGIYFSQNKMNVKVYVPLFFIILSLCASCLEAKYLIERSHSLVGCGIKPTSVIYSTLLMVILFGYRIDKHYRTSYFYRIIEVLGRYSFGIYLTHLYILRIVMHFISMIKISIPGLMWLLLTLIVLLITFVSLWIVKLISKNISKYCFGVV